MPTSTQISVKRNVKEFSIDSIQDGEYIVWSGGVFIPSTGVAGGGGSTGNGSIDRVIDPGDTVTILDKHSMVVVDYYDVQGTLELQGDATLEVLGGTPVSHFKAHMSASQTISADTSTLVDFDTEDWDIGSDYDTTNKEWTPPAGKIEIYAQLGWTGLASGDWLGIRIYKNGALFARHFMTVSNANQNEVSITCQDEANGTDVYRCEAWTGTNSNDITNQASASYWFGRMVGIY